jgi:hypothetical protein
VSDTTYETMQAPLINHALQAMLNDHGRHGWELVGVDGETAELRRPEAAAAVLVWEYATVPMIPAAREVILGQWHGMGYELVLETAAVAYFKRSKEA